MAHASRPEKAKLLLKKASKAKQKRKHIFNQLTLEEQEAKTAKRYEKNLDEKLRLLEWDYSHRQLPEMRFPYFADIIKEKIEEGVTEEEKSRLKRILGDIE